METCAEVFQCCVHCTCWMSEVEIKTNTQKISNFRVNLNAASEQPQCFTWMMTRLLSGGDGMVRTPPTPGKALWEMTIGASFCSVTLRRICQWQRSFMSGRNDDDDDDDKNTRIDCDWPEKHDISRIWFLPCFALLSLESTNHRTILITCCHRRAWWEIMFSSFF